MMGIPKIDLRETKPLGDPWRPPKEKPPQILPNLSIGAWIVYSIACVFLLVLVGLIIELFGPLIGIGIILTFVGKARIR